MEAIGAAVGPYQEGWGLSSAAATGKMPPGLSAVQTHLSLVLPFTEKH